MPSTRIITGDWVRNGKAALIEEVQQALLEGLKIPEDDRDIVLNLYREDERIIPPGRSERYTRIETMLYTGRTLAMKRRLYQAIVDRLGTFGIAKEDLKVILIEMPPENWGIRGGIPGSEFSPGFDPNP